MFILFIELTAKKIYVNKLSIMSKQMHHSKEEEEKYEEQQHCST